MANEIMIKYEVEGSEVKLSPKIVKEYLTGGQDITMAEFKMFAELCKVRKLNPFLKEAYIIKYGNSPATIVVGKDAILKRALKHPKFAGREQGIIVQKADGSIEERRGNFYLPDEKVVGGWAKVYRKDWEHPTYITVSLQEAIQTKKDGTPNSNWASKPATMIEKVALVRALRETFVEELGGMIDEDEAWKNEDIQQKEIIEPQIDPFEEKKDVTDTETIDIEEV